MMPSEGLLSKSGCLLPVTFPALPVGLSIYWWWFYSFISYFSIWLGVISHTPLDCTSCTWGVTRILQSHLSVQRWRKPHICPATTFCLLTRLWFIPPVAGILQQTLWAPSHMTSYLLTYSMVQSPSWEANWFAASQQIPLISRTLPHSQASATCLYPGPAQSSPYTHIPLSGDPS